MNKFNLYILATALVIAFSGCNNEVDTIYENSEQMVLEAKSNLASVSVTEFKVLFDEHAKLTLIDCREPNEFIKGHIPGAINIPRGVLEFSNKISNRRDKLYVYCLTYDRASLACVSLLKLKYSHVVLIDEGWEEWNKAYPEIIEEGSGSTTEVSTEPAEESGGCGG